MPLQPGCGQGRPEKPHPRVQYDTHRHLRCQRRHAALVVEGREESAIAQPLDDLRGDAAGLSLRDNSRLPLRGSAELRLLNVADRLAGNRARLLVDERRLTCQRHLLDGHLLRHKRLRRRCDVDRLIPDDGSRAVEAEAAAPTPFAGVRRVGARADEEGSRSKERYFSPRDHSSAWDVGDQPPEFWNQYKTEFAPGTHVRIHPLLDWTERDIWLYIQREGIPIPKMYFAREGGQGIKYRFRSLGCWPISGPVESNADTIDGIIDRAMMLRAGRLIEIESGPETLRDRYRRLSSAAS